MMKKVISSSEVAIPMQHVKAGPYKPMKSHGAQGHRTAFVAVIASVNDLAEWNFQQYLPCQLAPTKKCSVYNI